jgi:hypothetical protein
MANFQLGDQQKVSYSLAELDKDGNPAVVQAGDTVVIVSSDTESIAVVPDATPAPGTAASGFLVGGKKLQTGVKVTATITHTDGTTLTVEDDIDVVGGPATSISLGLGSPVSQ